MGNNVKTVIADKEDYEIFKFTSGYFGICEVGSSGGNCVHGGDSANEDDYDKDYMNAVYEQWDGTLYYDERYGYRIKTDI